MLIAECPCGVSRILTVGVTRFFDPESKRLVVAFDPIENDLISIDEVDAKSRNLAMYVDAYPNVDGKVFKCPKCSNKTLKFYKCGNWD